MRVESTKPRNLGDQLCHAIRFHEIDAVIDVGANAGQYARRLRRHGYLGPVQSFEPLPEMHAALVAAAASDPDWLIAPACAIGDRDGEAIIEHAGESDMSSLLHQNELHRAISPSSAVIETFQVTMKRLDRPGVILNDGWNRLLVKIDVQGFEPQVLAGMERLWPRVAGLQIEMALVQTYVGERLWSDTVEAIEKRGFHLALLIPGYYERKLGRQLQVDGVFFRARQPSPNL